MDVVIALALTAAAVATAALLVGGLVWLLRSCGVLRPRRVARAELLEDPEATQELPAVRGGEW